IIPLAMSVPPIQISVIINPGPRFQVDRHPAIGLASGAPGETPVSLHVPRLNRPHRAPHPLFYIRPLMATSTRNTRRSAAPAIIDNYERERVLNRFRQFGYLEAELNQ